MNSLSIILIFIALFNTFLAVYTLKFRKSQAAVFASGFLFSLALHSFGYAFELSSNNLDAAVFWVCFEFTGISFLSTFWLFFIIYLLGKKDFVPNIFKIFCFALSAIIALIVITSKYHNIFLHSATINHINNLSLINFASGPIYWILQMKLILLLSISIFLLFKMLKRDKSYRYQVIALLSGSLLPIVSYIIYLSGYIPYGIDFTPFTYLLIGIFFALALFKYALLDFVPPALEYVLENLSAGILIVDAKLRIIYVNQVIHAIFPFLNKSSIGSNASQKLLHYPEICSFLSVNDNVTFEADIYVKHHLSHFQINTSNYYNENCRLPGKIVIFQDITNRKKTELSLIEANTTKDRFLSIIAHDLKSPFNALIGISDLLIKENDFTHHQISNFIRVINDTARNSYTLLDNLLTWAMAQRDQINFDLQEIELMYLFNDTINQIKPHAKSKNISLKSLLNKPIQIYADQNMIQTVLRNLISNAVKFSTFNDVVTLTAFKNENDIVIAITDNGIGMSDDDITKLFRIDISNTQIGNSKEKGTGLGLIICNEFVKKHGGRIWVDSMPNKGCTFYFSIPLKKNVN